MSKKSFALLATSLLMLGACQPKASVTVDGAVSSDSAMMEASSSSEAMDDSSSSSDSSSSDAAAMEVKGSVNVDAE